MSCVYTVKQLNTYVKSILDYDEKLNLISVSGEISNFKNHYSSGHLYFSLKDSDALIQCVMFRTNAALLKFLPRDGDKVICTGRVSLYEKDGRYQLYAENMQPYGTGDLAENFRIVKEKLEKEGLFSEDTKRKLPKYPKGIAIITSDTGAALRDLINIISRRYPVCRVYVYPALVQGVNAPSSLINALENAYNGDNADVIIIGRGGGSAEDLAAFNDENLARKIYESPIPVISAVGHETDFTICDFVADMRAPTPSAAAELAVPDISDIRRQLRTVAEKMNNLLSSKIQLARLRLKASAANVYFTNPALLTDKRQDMVNNLKKRLDSDFLKIGTSAEKRLTYLTAQLSACDPLKVLSRGYSVVQKGDITVRDASDVNVGDRLSVKLFRGSLTVETKSVEE